MGTCGTCGTTQAQPWDFCFHGFLLHFSENVIFFHIELSMWAQRCLLTRRQPPLNCGQSLHRSHCARGHLHLEPHACSCMVGKHSADEPGVVLNQVPDVLALCCVWGPLPLVVAAYTGNTEDRGDLSCEPWAASQFRLTVTSKLTCWLLTPKVT